LITADLKKRFQKLTKKNSWSFVWNLARKGKEFFTPTVYISIVYHDEVQEGKEFFSPAVYPDDALGKKRVIFPTCLSQLSTMTRFRRKRVLFPNCLYLYCLP
jgi:hypothetical protein